MRSFSPYLTAKVDEKKKQRDPAWAKREAILDALDQRDNYYWSDRGRQTARRSIRAGSISRCEMQAPGLVGTDPPRTRRGQRLSQGDVSTQPSRKPKQLHECHDVVAGMVRAATSGGDRRATSPSSRSSARNADYFGYWFGHLIVDLPKTALPRLEALIPKLNERVADSLLGYIQQLREKP